MTAGFGFNRPAPAGAAPHAARPAAPHAAPAAPAGRPAAPATAGPRGPAPAGRPAAPPAPPARSRWAGVQCAKDRDPKFNPGHYVVRVLSNEITIKPDHTRAETFHGKCEIVWAAEGSEDHVGDQRVFWQPLSTSYAFERVKSYVVAAAGYDEPSYDAFDPEGGFLDSVCGTVNPASQPYIDAGMTVVGRLVEVRVTRGREMLDPQTQQPTGDHWREHKWSPTPEEQQDTTPMPAWAAA